MVFFESLRKLYLSYTIEFLNAVRIIKIFNTINNVYRILQNYVHFPGRESDYLIAKPS